MSVLQQIAHYQDRQDDVPAGIRSTPLAGSPRRDPFSMGQWVAARWEA